MACVVASSAMATEEFPIYTEHPRILLGRRLRLLRRERDRRAPRWTRLEALIGRPTTALPEPGFALALYYRVADDRDAGRRAVAWALDQGRDLRQLAMVFDWCQDLLDAGQTQALAAKLRAGIEESEHDRSVEAVRSRLLAGVALAGHLPAVSSAAVESTIKEWWEKEIVPSLAAGRDPFPVSGQYALCELLHVVRDNLRVDLRESAPAYFQKLPLRHLMAYYPEPWSTGDAEYRLPASRGMGAPDLERAIRARAAALSMVALDPNANPAQFLQGWLMHDRFELETALGAPYEFLWANQYQPGLSYDHAGLLFYDAFYGHFSVRSDWDDSASWLGVVDGEVQFAKGRGVKVLDPRGQPSQLEVGPAILFFSRGNGSFHARPQNGRQVFVFGLEPGRKYRLEVDGRKPLECPADPSGILLVNLPPAANTGFRLRAAKSN